MDDLKERNNFSWLIVINSLAHRDDLQFVIPVVYSLVFLFWLGVGIRQWIVFSRWTQKYRLYNEVQKKLDERLDFNKGRNKEEGQKITTIISDYLLIYHILFSLCVFLAIVIKVLFDFCSLFFLALVIVLIRVG